MTTEIQEYSQTEAAIATLQDNYGGVIWDVTIPSELEQARAARREIRTYRVNLEKMRVELKAGILERGRMIDGEAKRITIALESLEKPIDEQIKTEEQRKEREAQAEQLRISEIQKTIADYALIVPEMAGKTAAQIAERIEQLQAYKPGEWAMEFTLKAEQALKSTILALQQLHAGALAQEQAAAAEAAKVAAERTELARLRAEQDERARTEQARVAEETRRRAEAEAESRAKIEAAERASREKIEAEERAARQAREAEEAKIKAERAQLDEERRAADEAARKVREEQEAKAKAEREAEEAKRREIQRQKDELLGAYDMLAAFKKRFGHIHEFAGVIAAIDAIQPAKKAA